MKVDRFGDVTIEAGLLALGDVLLHPEAAERHRRRLASLANSANEIDAGAIRQAKVAQENVKILSFRQSNGFPYSVPVCTRRPHRSGRRSSAHAVSGWPSTSKIFAIAGRRDVTSFSREKISIGVTQGKPCKTNKGSTDHPFSLGSVARQSIKIIAHREDCSLGC
jgi:hypothetical protein